MTRLAARPHRVDRRVEGLVYDNLDEYRSGRGGGRRGRQRFRRGTCRPRRRCGHRLSRGRFRRRRGCLAISRADIQRRSACGCRWPHRRAGEHAPTLRGRRELGRRCRGSVSLRRPRLRVRRNSGSGRTPVKPGSSPSATRRSRGTDGVEQHRPHDSGGCRAVRPMGTGELHRRSAVMYIDGIPTRFPSQRAVRSRLGGAPQRVHRRADRRARHRRGVLRPPGWTVTATMWLRSSGRWDLGGFEAETLEGVHDWNRAVGAADLDRGMHPTAGSQQVGCSYTLENDLSRFFGADPAAESSRVSTSPPAR